MILCARARARCLFVSLLVAAGRLLDASCRQRCTPQQGATPPPASRYPAFAHIRTHQSSIRGICSAGSAGSAILVCRGARCALKQRIHLRRRPHRGPQWSGTQRATVAAPHRSIAYTDPVMDRSTDNQPIYRQCSFHHDFWTLPRAERFGLTSRSTPGAEQAPS